MFHHRGYGEAYRAFKIFPLSRRIINQRDRGEADYEGYRLNSSKVNLHPTDVNFPVSFPINMPKSNMCVPTP